MTVDDAVKILNAHKHGDCDQWRVYGEASLIVSAPFKPGIFTAFEAIAIADWYVRNTEDPEGAVQT